MNRCISIQAQNIFPVCEQTISVPCGVPTVGIPPKPRHKITNEQQLLSALISVLANMRKWVAIKDKNNVTRRNLSYV